MRDISNVSGSRSTSEQPIGALASSISQPSRAQIAHKWSGFGFNIIPLIPGTVMPSVNTTNWHSSAAGFSIAAHWDNHPDDDVGFIVGDSLLVCIVNDPDAKSRLISAERDIGAWPTTVVITPSGEEHYFWLDEGTKLPTSIGNLLGQVELKTGSSILALPPFGGKSVSLDQASNTSEFSTVGQSFVDALFAGDSEVVVVKDDPDGSRVPMATDSDGDTHLLDDEFDLITSGEAGADVASTGSTTFATFTAFAERSQTASEDAPRPESSTDLGESALAMPNKGGEAGEGGAPGGLVDGDTAFTPFTAFSGPNETEIGCAPEVPLMSTASDFATPMGRKGGEAGEGGVPGELVDGDTSLTASDRPGTEPKLDSEGSLLSPQFISASTSPEKGGEAGEGAAAAQRPDLEIQDHDVLTPKAAVNPVIAALKDKGLYRTPLGSGRHSITCPWAHEHDDTSVDAAVFTEPDEFDPTGRFDCPHRHVSRLTMADLLEHLGVPKDEAKHKPVIRVVEGELHRLVDAMERELANRGSHFQSGSLIVTVTTNPQTNDPAIVPTDVPALTRALSVTATFEKFSSKDARWIPTDPPSRHISILHKASTYRHLSVLEGVARQSYIREADGALVTAPGYDPISRRFGVFDPSQFRFSEPTMEAAHAALAKLEELLAEFRFASTHDKAAALSAILTAAVRSSLPFAPAFHVKAPVIGSGKSHLCELISVFAGPSHSAKVSYPSTTEEATKVMLSLLVKNPAVVEFDDMATDWIPHGVINRMLTSEHITDRILGFSKTATVSTRVLFLGLATTSGQSGICYVG